MQVSKKLFLGFSFCVTLGFTTTGICLYQMRQMQKITDVIFTTSEQAVSAAKATSIGPIAGQTMLSHVITHDNERAESEWNLDVKSPTLAQLEGLEKMASTEGQKKILETLRNSFENMKSIYETKLVPDINANKEVTQNQITLANSLVESATTIRDDALRLSNELMTISERQQKIVTKTFQDTIIMVLIIAMIALMGSVFAAIMSTKIIEKPLKEMINVAKKIAVGEIDISISYTSKDELGDLADSFRQMMDYIRSLSHVLTEISNQNLSVEIKAQSSQDFLAKAIVQLLNNFKEAVKSIKEITDAIEGISREQGKSSAALAAVTHEHASSLEETSAAIEEMNAMLANSTSNAAKALEISSLNEQTATDGKKIIAEVITAVSSISTCNSEIFSQIEKNNTELMEITKIIEEIGQKTAIINDIVFQTKLLSFNASVEAARAGEHGKGFAVVAEEVGNLARMSGNASKEIGEMLSRSNAKVEQIITASRSSILGLTKDAEATVQNGIKTVNKCSEVFQEIYSSAKNLQKNVTDISTASFQQAQGISEITKSIQQMEQVTQQTADMSETGAKLAENLFTSGTNLSAILNHFKIQN